MQRALELAQQGMGRTSPNPPVGCVVVRNSEVIAEGYHQKAGLDHAEIDALKKVSGSATGATAYVTLEPCNHQGRTGPCTDALIAAGVTRVVVGTTDPNPRVSGSGIERLRKAGIQVDQGVLQPECNELIRPFSKWVTTGRPLVTLKVATTLDGKIATSTGHSQWITGQEARLDVHERRDQIDAILVGAGTVRMDNPRLTTRLPSGNGHNPLRIVISRSGDLPLDANVFSDPSHTVIVTDIDNEATAMLSDKGATVWVVGHGPSGIDLGALLDKMGAEEITNVVVEGGKQLATAFLSAQLVDRLCCYVGTSVIGGDGLGWMGPLGFEQMNDVVHLTHVTVRQFGTDVCIEGNCVYGNS